MPRAWLPVWFSTWFKTSIVPLYKHYEPIRIHGSVRLFNFPARLSSRAPDIFTSFYDAQTWLSPRDKNGLPACLISDSRPEKTFLLISFRVLCYTKFPRGMPCTLAVIDLTLNAHLGPFSGGIHDVRADTQRFRTSGDFSFIFPGSQNGFTLQRPDFEVKKT